MTKKDLRNTLENNPVKDFDTMEAENQLEPIDNKIEDYEWHRHFCMGTKTYQLEDGLVKVRGVLNIVESMEWSDIDEYCEIVD